jgi:hypothetical protein
VFGVLADFPPGHDRLYFHKRFDARSASARPQAAHLS